MMQVTSQITSIHSKQAAKITAVMAFVAVLAATWPLAGAAWAFSVHLPRKHFMVLLFVPFFYALATYFLVGMGCALYNFAARTVGGLRIEVAHHTHDTEVAEAPVNASAEKPASLRKVA
jgi:Ni/Fe-hydrogenase subunit HybB-like protein